jgi:molybdopterin-containing oxidoreductase family iron-sulfur binding subunit
MSRTDEGMTTTTTDPRGATPTAAGAGSVGEGGAAGRWWRSQEYLRRDPALLERLAKEFPHGIEGLDISQVTRRGFMGLMGASLALAGVTLSGCVRKPAQYILPFAKRPEDRIPGQPDHYATVARVGGQTLGLVVESQDGRPTKVEGNPSHPFSNPFAARGGQVGPADGATNTFAQALVLELYDPDRSTAVRQPPGAESTWAAFDAALGAELERHAASGGRGLALLVDAPPSPSFRAALAAFRARFPQALVASWSPDEPRNRRAGAAAVGLAGHQPLLEVHRADVILALDADFLGLEGDTVRNARLWAERRRVAGPESELNRLYVAEPGFSITGMQADERLRCRAGRVGDLLRAIAAEVGAAGVGAARGGGPLATLAAPALATSAEVAFAKAAAADLVANEGRALVVVGERQPPGVHALGLALNEALGALGATLRLVPDADAPALATIEELAAAIGGGQVEALAILDANPVHTAPADLGFGELLAKVPFTWHHGYRVDETAVRCGWHTPTSHLLEAWGDLRATDGTVAIQQPLIAPLFATRSTLAVLGRLAGVPAAVPQEDPGAAPASPQDPGAAGAAGATASAAPDGTAAAEPEEVADPGYELVRQTWAGRVGDGFDQAWRRWLHDGVVDPDAAAQPAADRAARPEAARLAAALSAAGEGAPADGLEVDFVLSPSVYDGRYANNAWLQELPDPLTKLTWDNAALLAPRTAERLGVADGDVVRVGLAGREVVLAAWMAPGLAEDVVLLPLGYGRAEGGRVARGAGVDVYPLRTTAALHFAAGAALEKTGDSYALACTQEHGTMVEPHTGALRPVARAATLAEYRADPHFVERAEVLPAERVRSLWDEPNATHGQQWGMTIDLATCIGCNACTIACQAENNIPVVGKERVLNGREMHWIRVDRYFTGPLEEPRALTQPVPCMHCENAPCEGVCPVAATVHSPDGLNDMAYNRCIGTRYCSNNCPYKVRRFNFFNYQAENQDAAPLLPLQRNPDVTVRFRGVMEKCTYCVQRISQARIAAKRDGDGTVPDGAVVPACAQACPTRAITFGDVNDPQSEVSRQKQQPRNYALLRELNTQPRTTYLARVTNPNPARGA